MTKEVFTVTNSNQEKAFKYTDIFTKEVLGLKKDIINERSDNEIENYLKSLQNEQWTYKFNEMKLRNTVLFDDPENAYYKIWTDEEFKNTWNKAKDAQNNTSILSLWIDNIVRLLKSDTSFLKTLTEYIQHLEHWSFINPFWYKEPDILFLKEILSTCWWSTEISKANVKLNTSQESVRKKATLVYNDFQEHVKDFPHDIISINTIETIAYMESYFDPTLMEYGWKWLFQITWDVIDQIIEDLQNYKKDDLNDSYGLEFFASKFFNTKPYSKGALLSQLQFIKNNMKQTLVNTEVNTFFCIFNLLRIVNHKKVWKKDTWPVYTTNTTENITQSFLYPRKRIKQEVDSENPDKYKYTVKYDILTNELLQNDYIKQLAKTLETKQEYSWLSNIEIIKDLVQKISHDLYVEWINTNDNKILTKKYSLYRDYNGAEEKDIYAMRCLILERYGDI